ncbi:MAG: ChbG/HpnK family deacetylase [Acidobacteriaceae bacterium]
MNDSLYTQASEPAAASASARNISGAQVIINADDWGRDRENTDRSLACVLAGVMSSASAMVFMEDSERSADLAREHAVDCGLHLNLTTAFSAPQSPARLRDHQRKLSRYLRSLRLAQALYHPFLTNSFEYVVKTQREEFERLYGAPAGRIDGHHHMHLCANVVRQGLLPAGTMVRRNFSFGPSEKSSVNRWYRDRQDKVLARRHSMTDFFFSLPPLEPRLRLKRIFTLALQFNVEVETHPVNAEEYGYLMDGNLLRDLGALQVAPSYRLRSTDERTAA